VNGNQRLQAVLHDTTACYRFVKATAAACKLNSGFPSYSDSTKKLLTYIKKLAGKSLEFLAAFNAADSGDPDSFREKRELLWLIREAWTTLHKYVQPAVDADTLNVPGELVRLLTDRVRLIDGCELLEFAVIHTDQLNYFQFPPGDFEEKACGLADVLDAGLEFPAHLGIIASPHSQSQHIFLNTLLAHEIGHSVFSKLNCLDRIKNGISEGLRAAFVPPVDVALDASQLKRYPEVLQDWAEELFCDLFGVYMLGPTFALASIELFDLGNLWAFDSGIDHLAGGEQFKFQSKHPAKLFRLWRQTELLKTLGWWKAIEKTKSHHIGILSSCLELKPSSFTFEGIVAPQGEMLINAFCRAVEAIEGEAASVAKNLLNIEGQAREVGEFSELGDKIATYLCHAVVPSSIYFRDGFRIPTPVVLLNAAHLFYLSGIEDLMANTDKPDSTKIEQRELWMERIENWTTKGLEDIALPREGSQ
jgi:hypothetical protein